MEYSGGPAKQPTGGAFQFGYADDRAVHDRPLDRPVEDARKRDRRPVEEPVVQLVEVEPVLEHGPRPRRGGPPGRVDPPGDADPGQAEGDGADARDRLLS